MSEETTPQQRAAATKRKRTIAKTVEAAALLFDTHGWHGVTLGDIAKEAGVSAATISVYFPTKRSVALGAYASELLSMLELVESEDDREALIGFVTELADTTTAHPVLAIALLPATRDTPRASDEVHLTSEEVTLVDFDQLAELLGRLLANYRGRNDDHTDVAELYLSGLLSWVLKHPDRTGEDAAQLVLRQLL